MLKVINQKRFATQNVTWFSYDLDIYYKNVTLHENGSMLHITEKVKKFRNIAFFAL